MQEKSGVMVCLKPRQQKDLPACRAYGLRASLQTLPRACVDDVVSGVCRVNCRVDNSLHMGMLPGSFSIACFNESPYPQDPLKRHEY